MYDIKSSGGTFAALSKDLIRCIAEQYFDQLSKIYIIIFIHRKGHAIMPYYALRPRGTAPRGQSTALWVRDSTSQRVMSLPPFLFAPWAKAKAKA